MKDAERFFEYRYAEDFTRAALTMLDQKAVAYAAEPGYRETLYELARRFSSTHELAQALRRKAIALLRPDAIAHSKVTDTIAYFARLGIRPVHVVRTEVTRQAVREVWRYQLNAASGQRLRLLDLLFGASPSLLAFFEADSTAPRIPCAVLMADCKGPANVAERQGWELRAHLRSPNRIEVYVHCGDEPADVVRDGGLLLGPVGFAEAVVHPPEPDAASAVEMLAREVATTHRSHDPVAVDPLFRASLGESPARGHLDRWVLLRTVAGERAVVAGQAETLISDSGIHRWWQRFGLLETRQTYLTACTGWLGGRLADPLP